MARERPPPLDQAGRPRRPAQAPAAGHAVVRAARAAQLRGAGSAPGPCGRAGAGRATRPTPPTRRRPICTSPTPEVASSASTSMRRPSAPCGAKTTRPGAVRSIRKATVCCSDGLPARRRRGSRPCGRRPHPPAGLPRRRAPPVRGRRPPGRPGARRPPRGGPAAPGPCPARPVPSSPASVTVTASRCQADASAASEAADAVGRGAVDLHGHGLRGRLVARDVDGVIGHRVLALVRDGHGGAPPRAFCSSPPSIR